MSLFVCLCTRHARQQLSSFEPAQACAWYDIIEILTTGEGRVNEMGIPWMRRGGRRKGTWMRRGGRRKEHGVAGKGVEDDERQADK
jgi:hypothetical protein